MNYEKIANDLLDRLFTDAIPRSFFQQIGSKGGRNGKFSLAKRLSAQKAAKARWDKRRASHHGPVKTNASY